MKRLTGTSVTAVATAPIRLASYPVADWSDLLDRISWLVRSSLADRVSPGRLDEYTSEATQCGASWVLEYVTDPGGLPPADLARRAARQGVRTMFRQLVDYQRDKALSPAPDSPAGLPEPEPLPEATRLAELQAIRWQAKKLRAEWERLTAVWASAVRPVRRLRVDRGMIGWRSSHNRRSVDLTWLSILSAQTVTAGGQPYETAGPAIDRGHIVTGVGSGVAGRPSTNGLAAVDTIVSYRWLPGVPVFGGVHWFAPQDREDKATYERWLGVFAR